MPGFDSASIAWVAAEKLPPPLVKVEALGVAVVLWFPPVGQPHNRQVLRKEKGARRAAVRYSSFRWPDLAALTSGLYDDRGREE